VYLIVYLTTLSVSRLYSVDDAMIKECGAVVGMSIDGRKKKCSEITRSRVITYLSMALQSFRWTLAAFSVA
jgi:hypothetical protein